MGMSKSMFSLYNSLLYRLIVVVDVCLGIYVCFAHDGKYDLLSGILLIAIGPAYWVSLKYKSHLLMWIVLFVQVALAYFAYQPDIYIDP